MDTVPGLCCRMMMKFASWLVYDASIIIYHNIQVYIYIYLNILYTCNMYNHWVPHVQLFHNARQRIISFFLQWCLISLHFSLHHIIEKNMHVAI